MNQPDSWLMTNLVCPRDHQDLTWHEDHLTCSLGHWYPRYDGIPIMMLEEAAPTHPIFQDTWRRAMLPHEQRRGGEPPQVEGSIDPFVQEILVGTCGNLYQSLRQKLPRYPIPELRLANGDGKLFLDVGCNWGRWCISAAQKGFQPVGIDPSLDSIIAARRVAQQLGVTVAYVVADSRYLPFRSHVFDIVFSYSVLQHLAKDNVRFSLDEIARVMGPSGNSLVQMPNTWGLHNLYVQWRRRGTELGLFDVRYWKPQELRDVFQRHIGPSELTVDGYFSLNAQSSDKDLLPPTYRVVVTVSDLLRAVSTKFRPLIYLADSLYVQSQRM